MATSTGSEAQARTASVALLVVLDPGYHEDVRGHGVVCAGEVGRVAVAVVAAGRKLM